MNRLKNISRLTEKVIHKYNQLERQQREYGEGIILKQAEIHTISLIGDFPDINVTTLAQKRGITRGGASQMIYKLVDKGLVSKQISPDSDTEVCLSLTEMGEKAYQAHIQYHEEYICELFKELEDIPEDYVIFLIKLLEKFDKSIDERLNNQSL